MSKLYAIQLRYNYMTKLIVKVLKTVLLIHGTMSSYNRSIYYFYP